MNQAILRELFVDQIQDIYDAEQQLVKALPKLAKAAESEDLAEALRAHLGETETHVTRLEEIFGMLDMSAKGKPCKAMKGLVEEGGEAAKEEKGARRDLAMIAGGQRVEHYEISAYGTARTMAEQLGLDEAAQLLQKTEDEEKNADAKLTEVATSLYDSMGDESDDEGMEAVSVGSGQGSKAGTHGAGPTSGRSHSKKNNSSVASTSKH